ncbi:MAG: maltose alpha-D-glucosyltransferase [Polyangiales bacterium]
MSHGPRQSVTLGDDPQWYKDAVIYELHVRSFADSDNDGVGDFKGLISRLDYLEDLGVNALWLLPFYPSPLKDEGYDIADYNDVNPAYGTLDDFKEFLDEAHRRGIRVITELVINHTSSQHPWFQRARRAPKGHPDRDFYVWADKPEAYRDARIIFKDFEASNWSYDPVAKAYYWHRFYHHQPDLNFDNPAVHEAVFKAMEFWLDMGVDGMRLDAVPYLYEREGTNCENLPETHAFLKKLRARIDARYPGRMLLAEANQWPEDAARYFGDGDECHMNFHFPLMPRMFMALYMEDRFPILDILKQTPEIPDGCQWAVFLRNHDELTLEMVTDEDRDSMWRVYAQDAQARINLGIRRRLAPLLQTRRKIELMNALLFSLPGTPVLYYGDEIGMGDNFYLGDRDGVRTPMQWSPDRNAGFSKANPQKLYLPVIVDPEHHYESVNVETQQGNASSLLWWMKRIIAARRTYKALGRGALEFLRPRNKSVLAFVRSFEDERILVVANLSRHAQYVELDLSAHAGRVPEELFGRERFARVGREPYSLTLAPHAFFWLSLENAEAAVAGDDAPLPKLAPAAAWEALFSGPHLAALEKLLPAYLKRQRWFRGKSRRVNAVTLRDRARPDLLPDDSALAWVTVSYFDGDEDVYFLPLAASSGADARGVLDRAPRSAIAELNLGGREVVLHDAALSPEFASALLRLVASAQRVDTEHAQLRGSLGFALEDPAPPPRVGSAEQTNTSVVFGESYILKLFRLVEPGLNPDVELTRFLHAGGRDAPVPELLGSLEYRRPKLPAASLATVQRFIPSRGDAWSYTLETLGLSLEHTLASAADAPALPPPEGPLLAQAASPVPPSVEEFVGPYLPFARLLAQRTAQVHLALASEPDDPDFAPESFSELHQRSMYQSARTALAKAVEELEARVDALPEHDQALARSVIAGQSRLDAKLRAVAARKVDALRVRCHGDFHLGQVLHTGGDVVILDFEGEPTRALGERRYKRNPLRDVAGMIRSFHYAAVTAEDRQRIDSPRLREATRAWAGWVSAAYLGAYLDAAAGASFLPTDRGDWEVLLRFYLLEKCIYELRYEMAARPDWLHVPLEGLTAFLHED